MSHHAQRQDASEHVIGHITHAVVSDDSIISAIYENVFASSPENSPYNHSLWISGERNHLDNSSYGQPLLNSKGWCLFFG